MTPDSRQKLRNLLLHHESFRAFPYTDTTGHLTIGIGRNLTDRGISQDEALLLLDDDIQYFTHKLSSMLPFFGDISENRRIVLVDMCFNLGLRGFLGFNRFLDAVQNSDWEMASQEILSSKAAFQCPERYQQLAYIMRTDEL